MKWGPSRKVAGSAATAVERRLDDFDWSASITLDRRLLDAVFSLGFLDSYEHVLLPGPADVGKSFLAQALGFTAIRAGYTGRFVHSDDYFKVMAQARTTRWSADLYELILNRHRVSSFIFTSNRAVDEWLGLFEDPILGNSALDRLANASYQIVIEGSSYRERQSPHRALLAAGGEGGD